MKLSEAIRKGANTEGVYSAKGTLVGKLTGRNDLVACALGMSFIGLKGRECVLDIGANEEAIKEGYECIHDKFPILRTHLHNYPEELYPEEREVNSSIKEVIIDLNDTHGWSAKAIAEWVKTLEDYNENNNRVATNDKTSEVEACESGEVLVN